MPIQLNKAFGTCALVTFCGENKSYWENLLHVPCESCEFSVQQPSNMHGYELVTKKATGQRQWGSSRSFEGGSVRSNCFHSDSEAFFACSNLFLS